MSTTATATKESSRGADPHGAAGPNRRRRRDSSPARSILAQGEPLIWLTGGALVFAVVMILGLLGLVLTLGLATFRPGELLQVQLRDGRVLLGELSKQERFAMTADAFAGEPTDVQQSLVENWIAKVSLNPGLVAELDRKVDRLRREVSRLTARGDVLSERIRQLDQGRAQSDDPFDRARMIRSDSQTRKSQQARHDQVALQQGLAALQGEMDAAQKAADYFRQLPDIDAQSLLQAAGEARAAGIDALIRLVKRTDEDAIRFRRRMLRTGNYELTNEHFNWVADYQIRPDGESRPKQATLVERLAWGRFYGEPRTLTVKHRRPVTNGERELATLIDFWQKYHIDTVDTDQTESSEAAGVDVLDELQAEHVALRAKATKSFVDDLQGKLQEGQELRLLLSSGEQKASDEFSPDDDVTQAWIITHDAAQVWQEFEDLHPDVLSRQLHIGHLEKHELGGEYAQQEAARLRVRQAELDHDLSLATIAADLLKTQATRSTIDDAQDDAAAIATIVQRRFGDGSPIGELLMQLVQLRNEQLGQQRATSESVTRKILAELKQSPPSAEKAVLAYVDTERSAAEAAAVIQAEIEHFREQNSRYELEMETADGQSKSLAVSDIVRAFQPNQLSRSAGWGVYLSRWWEFLTQDPREANSEGGVLPAIWGTVVMTMIMSIAVVPFGVVAALYLREYAKSGPIVSIIRIAINNLAGVPSIVFGVFGLGFFCYIVGAYIDGGPENAGFQPLPPPRWFMVLGALAVIALAAFVGGMIGFRGPAAARSPLRRWLAVLSTIAWLIATVVFVIVVVKTPFFNGHYEANLPNPYWGKGGVVWASLTLALMTLPVVIVATEEALSAVPNSMREGSYGCGASKWQTIRRIVLPHAMPGIMTGMILAMARGAGEVAPLMLVGAVKLAPELPIDGTFPFLHGNRSFMHLGFHIFDVGFQSQNSEAAKPMVYTTTLLLIVIITVLNLVAVWLRAYLKKRFATGQF